MARQKWAKSKEEWWQRMCLGVSWLWGENKKWGRPQQAIEKRPCFAIVVWLGAQSSWLVRSAKKCLENLGKAGKRTTNRWKRRGALKKSYAGFEQSCILTIISIFQFTSGTSLKWESGKRQTMSAKLYLNGKNRPCTKTNSKMNQQQHDRNVDKHLFKFNFNIINRNYAINCC